LRFLVDAQLPPALARQIEGRGHTAEHVDCGLATAPDRTIRAYAASVGAIIITKNEDFVVLKLLESGPPVIWVRVGNTRRAHLLHRIDADSPRFSTPSNMAKRSSRSSNAPPNRLRTSDRRPPVLLDASVVRVAHPAVRGH